MSLDPVSPPYNSSDPNASFLSSSCLDFLLIELVPLAQRVSSSDTVEGAGEVADSNASRKEEEEDAVHFRLESLGYRVGQGLVERYVRDRDRGSVGSRLSGSGGCRVQRWLWEWKWLRR